ncbi:hypothetical protein [Brachybacterium sillae]|uniref:hypothetical protein n=1 Tax=Brachybacterium sillae TaxID=2810536 RepID=UPI00217E8421|nr:hypothetical protein [Brachybacterium sillae]
MPRPEPAPPEAAVHTLRESDPRPALRPLRVREELIRIVGADWASDHQIIETVADPEDVWTADAGVSDHFQRGGLVVQVRRADNAVIGVFSRSYALSVRPDDVQRGGGEDARSVRGGMGTRHPTTRRELLERLAAAGFEVHDGRTHGRITHPLHPGLFVPLASTPGDQRRFTRNVVTQVRRVFGVDLR